MQYDPLRLQILGLEVVSIFILFLSIELDMIHHLTSSHNISKGHKLLDMLASVNQQF